MPHNSSRSSIAAAGIAARATAKLSNEEPQRKRFLRVNASSAGSAKSPANTAFAARAAITAAAAVVVLVIVVLVVVFLVVSAYLVHDALMPPPWAALRTHPCSPA